MRKEILIELLIKKIQLSQSGLLEVKFIGENTVYFKTADIKSNFMDYAICLNVNNLIEFDFEDLMSNNKISYVNCVVWQPDYKNYTEGFISEDGDYFCYVTYDDKYSNSKQDFYCLPLTVEDVKKGFVELNKYGLNGEEAVLSNKYKFYFDKNTKFKYHTKYNRSYML